MRKFENIKPLHLEPPARGVPMFKNPWKKIDYVNPGENPSAETTAYNSAVDDLNKAGRKMSNNKWIPWKTIRDRRTSNYNAALENYNTATDNLKNSIPTPASIEDVTTVKQEHAADPAGAAETEQAVAEAKVDSATIGAAVGNAGDLVRSLIDATKAQLQKIKELGDDAGPGAKLGALTKAGAGITGAIGSQVATIFNKGPLTDLASDRDVNAGFDAAASIAGLFGPYGKLAEFGIRGIQALGNAWAGKKKPDFAVDRELQARLASSYGDTFQQVEKLAQGPGLAGIFNGGSQWQSKWNDMQAKYQTMQSIDATGLDAVTAGRYEGIGMSNEMSLSGGYSSLRAARHGMKMNLLFARKLTKAQLGLKFNSFKPVSRLGITIGNSGASEVPEALNTPWKDLEQKPFDFTKFDDLIQNGTISALELDGNHIFLVNDEDAYNAIMTNLDLIDNLKKRYLNVSIQFAGNPTNLDAELLTGALPVQEALLGVLSALLRALSVNLERLQESPVDLGAVQELLEGQKGWEDLEDLTDEQKLSILKTLDSHFEKDENGCYIVPPEFYNHQNNLKKLKKALEVLGVCIKEQNNSPAINLEQAPIRILKQGGVFTFFPTTDEEVLYFKEGGSFNVIPDGALHKNKHHMDDAEGLTKKGIPVVTVEDGKKIQLAEIELNEIIFRLEVTEQLEKLAKEDTDESAIEAGKLLVEEILHNTHDNTGLIKEIK